MCEISDFQTKPRLLTLSARRLLCPSRTLCLACVALGASAFCFARAAQAQERGAIGLELSAGAGELPSTSDNMYQPKVMFRDSLSAWYRLVPAFAIGSTVGAMQNQALDGANFSRDTFVESGKVLEAFAEGRLFPSSFIGAFGRASVGVAFLDVVPTFVPGPSHIGTAREPILELEGGPELRLFFAPQTSKPRPDLFLRMRGTVTTMSAATFPGLGLALGFEG